MTPEIILDYLLTAIVRSECLSDQDFAELIGKVSGSGMIPKAADMLNQALIANREDE